MVLTVTIAGVSNHKKNLGTDYRELNSQLKFIRYFSTSL